MLRLICLLGCVAVCIGDAVNVNEAVDHLLDGMKKQMQSEGKDRIPIPEIDGETTWKKAFIKFTGEVHCKDGWAGHLTTIHRTGDAVITTEGNVMMLKMSLGIGDLEARFDSCQLVASKLFRLTQPLEVYVSSNSISAQARLTRNGDECVASLDYIKLDDLGDVKLKTGSSVFHKLEDLILNLFTKAFHGKIKDSLNDLFDKEARKAIEKGDLCKNIPL